MSKTIALLLGASLLIIFAGCSKVIKTETFHDRQMDFSQYRSFAFFDQTGKPARLPDPFVNYAGAREAAKQIIETQLIDRGIRKERINEADFMIAIHAGSDDFLGPEMKHWRYSYGSHWHRDDNRSFPVGTLILDFVDADVNTVFWRGTAPDVLAADKAVPDNLQEVVARLLDDYPPESPAPEPALEEQPL